MWQKQSSVDLVKKSKNGAFFRVKSMKRGGYTSVFLIKKKWNLDRYYSGEKIFFSEEISPYFPPWLCKKVPKRGGYTTVFFFQN